MWSTHLAFGYVDHPPAVAWLIAAASWLGHSALAIRLPFILCEGLAALSVGGAAIALSGSERAGAVAAIVFALIPQLRWVIGEALPDGPYVLCWSAALWFGARAAKEYRLRDIALLGIALGGALLSRFFGWALVGGVLIAIPWRRTFWIAPAIAAAMYAPFLAWNASHGWMNFAFTLYGRRPVAALSLSGPDYYSTERFLLFAVIFCALAYLVTLRMQRLPLLAWTALPFPFALAILSFFQPVESYWLLGPFASLCAGIGIAFGRVPVAVRATLAAAWISGCAVTAYVALAGVANPSVTLGGGAAVYGSLARDLQSIANTHNADLLSNSYELAAEVTYHGAPATLVGDTAQARQWSYWRADDAHGRALLFTDTPRGKQFDLVRMLKRSYALVTPGPTLRYKLADTQRAYDTFWCEQPAAAR